MDGSERRYEYALCSEYGSSWKCTETLGAEHVIVSGNSTRTVHYYAENGDEIATDHLIHVSSDFVSVDFQQMTYDHSHRVIRTDYANGLHSSAEWSCTGPRWETDVRGLQTRYIYDGAKRLVCIERDSAVPVENWNGMEMTSTCPDSITEMTYDGAGNTLSVKNSTGDKATAVFTTYDLLGRIVSRTDELGRITLYSYSPDGLTTTETLPTGATLVTRLLPSGLVAEESGTGREARYYEYEGSLTSAIRKYIYLDSSHRRQIGSIIYDGMGRLIMDEKQFPQPTLTPVQGFFLFAMQGD